MANIVCYDSDGNILDHYTQWDTGQKLIIHGAEMSTAPVFHFFNAYIDTAYVVQSEIIDNCIVVGIPDLILQYGVPIIIYVFYELGTTEYSIRIPVKPRAKPNDYIYIDPDTGGSGGGSGTINIKIANDLITNDSRAALSAAQGVVIKSKIDLLEEEKLSISELGDSIEIAINDAIESGEFKGQDGAPGRGIASIIRTSGDGSAGTTDTYTITFTDGGTSIFTVYNGRDGSDGKDGVSTIHGDADTLDGKDSTYFATAQSVINLQEYIARGADMLYVQNEEPSEAADGALWVDMDAEGIADSGSSGGASVFVQDDEPADADTGTLWLDTDEESADSGGGSESVAYEIPTFNLTEMGLPPVPMDGTTVYIGNVDCSALRNALEAGLVKMEVVVTYNGFNFNNSANISASHDDWLNIYSINFTSSISTGGDYTMFQGTVYVRETAIQAVIFPMQMILPDAEEATF